MSKHLATASALVAATLLSLLLGAPAAGAATHTGASTAAVNTDGPTNDIDWP